MLAAPIRDALINQLHALDPTAVIFRELPLLRGQSRADVVAVNGVIAGFEIKSDADSLARLRTQAPDYETVCEFMTVVTGRRHLSKLRAALPKKWGISVVEQTATGIAIIPIRHPRRNAQLDRHALIRLLWKSDCQRILRANGVVFDRSSPVTLLWQMMERLSTRKLLGQVRDALKSRSDP